MNVEIALLPDEILDKDISNHLVVIIDILRASSTIVTALSEGANSVIPVYSIEKAIKVSEDLCSEQVLLCGERNGLKLPGFYLGNSPLEYIGKHIKSKIIILSTTNGTKALQLTRKAAKIIIGCFLNIGAVVSYCQNYNKDILMVCAGDRGNISLEDTVCAGMMKYLIENRNNGKTPPLFFNDDGQIAYFLYRKFKDDDDLIKVLETSVWGKKLKEKGFAKDLVFCAQKNLYKTIPVLENDCLVVADKF
ncbi:MAG: 2-phosphosulfolactate phosphatase [Candidatus Atribacteria bacterium]|jgi:2-phosphosulfolactate phosphatase|nr:2-phosphosulfolactate phosphatase [Candidatus Atribacteria bacterium]